MRRMGRVAKQQSRTVQQLLRHRVRAVDKRISMAADVGSLQLMLNELQLRKSHKLSSCSPGNKCLFERHPPGASNKVVVSQTATCTSLR